MATCRSRRVLLGASVALLVAAAALAGTARAVPVASPGTSCSTKAYAYAGLFSNISAQGIQTVLSTRAVPTTPSGHVAAWIGVGGPTSGPGGSPEWIQVGMNTRAGLGSELYVEIAQPGVEIKYQTVSTSVIPGAKYRLVLKQIPGQPNVWHVLVDGKVVAGPIFLAGSQHFEPMAMSESWNGGAPSCNGFNYRFDELRITTNGAWKPLTKSAVLTDRGYKVTDRTTSGFTALTA